MAGRFEKGSFSSPSKRRRRDYDCAESSRPQRKQHLYLALDDWNGCYSIHKLDADKLLEEATNSGGGGEGKLPEPAAIRIRSPVRGPMDFAALGTNIFFAPNPRFYSGQAPPTFVYDTNTTVLAVGPPLPTGIHGLEDAMAVGGKLYALTSPCFPEVPRLKALSWDLNERGNIWDPAVGWFWNTVPSLLPAPCDGIDIDAYALHPDGRTIFMSTASVTYSLDTSNGSWKELGDWVLPFKGQAYFVENLDAWVGIHHKKDGYICCCPVASRSTTTRRTPDCRMLNEKLFLRNNEKAWHKNGRHMKATLTYMGYSRFCLVENILCREDGVNSVLHVTLFSLKYDHMGELRSKVRPCTMSYAVSKNTLLFSHAAFWM